MLVAAVIHATWNLFNKQAASGGAPFAWMVAAAATLLYAPPAVVLISVTRPHLGWLDLGFIAGSAVLHTAYFLLLQRGYGHGDLSLVYPLARGTGPLLASLVAIPLFAERPGPWGLAGIVLVAGGVFALGLPDRSSIRPTPAAFGYGLATGVFIASYTLWDKHAVDALAIAPLLLMWGTDLGRCVLVAPLALRRRDQLPRLWRTYRWQVVGAGLLSPLAYILVLTAMSVSPVSAVAPMRELSVLVGVVLGGRLLAEGNLRRRLPAAVAIAGGIVAIAAG